MRVVHGVVLGVSSPLTALAVAMQAVASVLRPGNVTSDITAQPQVDGTALVVPLIPAVFNALACFFWLSVSSYVSVRLMVRLRSKKTFHYCSSM